MAHAPGDKFLICSDGLVEGLWDRRIEEIMRSHTPEPGAPTMAQAMVHEADLASGRDNTTAMVIEIPLPEGAP